MRTVNPNNTIFVSVAAWSDADRHSEVFRLSAKKQNINVRFIDYGAEWKGFYHHKIKNIYTALPQWQQEGFEYILFCDARDAVFAGSAEEITAKFAAMNRNAVLFAADKAAAVFPLQEPWFQDAMVNHCGECGIVNSGTYIGRIESVKKLFEECFRLRNAAQHLTRTPTTLVERTLQEGKHRFLEDDQFYMQVLQLQGYSGIQTDTDKELFAIFDRELPAVKKRTYLPMSDDRSIGTALVLHSPWLSRREDAWKQWAMQEGIID